MIETIVLAAVLSFLPLVVVTLFGAGTYAVFGDRMESMVVGFVLIELSFLLVAGAYLILTNDGFSIRIGFPSPTELLLALVIVPVPFVLSKVADAVFELDIGSDTPLDFTDESILVAVLVALFLVGPAEELLYRGIVQGLLVGPLGSIGGILVMAGLFGAVHYPTYGASSLRDIDSSVVAGCAQTGIIGAVYGGLYVVTGTLLVPIISHSIYDALLFVKTSR